MSRIIFILILLTAQLSAADYYVRKTGTDGAGHTGATGDPWLTLTYALTRINAAGGDRVLIGDGTYQEATYWSISTKYTSTTTFEGESGSASLVIVKGSGSSTYNVLLNSKNVTFKNITFTVGSVNDNSAFRISGGTNFVFDSCAFVSDTDSGKTPKCLGINGTGTYDIRNVLITGCSFSNTGGYNAYAVYLVPGVNQYIVDLTVTNSSIRVNGYGVLTDTTSGTNINVNVYSSTIHTGLSPLFLNKTYNLSIKNCSLISTNNHGVAIGRDANYDASLAATVTGSIDNCYVESYATHGLLVGADCHGVSIANCTVRGGDHGIVIKENNAIVCRNNISFGGTLAACISKGAVGADVQNNTLYSRNGSYCFKLYQGDAGRKSGTAIVKNNKLVCESLGKALYIEDSSGDAGGCVFDGNAFYYRDGSRVIGYIKGSTTLNTMEGLRISWAGYDVAGNDSTSHYGNNDIKFSVWR